MQRRLPKEKRKSAVRIAESWGRFRGRVSAGVVDARVQEDRGLGREQSRNGGMNKGIVYG